MANYSFSSDRFVILESPCNFEALDAELEVPAPRIETPITPQCKEKEEIENQNENSKLCKEKTKNRFRRLVRTIMANTLWAKETAQRCSKENEGFRTESGESLIFNVDAVVSKRKWLEVIDRYPGGAMSSERVILCFEFCYTRLFMKHGDLIMLNTENTETKLPTKRKHGKFKKICRLCALTAFCKQNAVSEKLSPLAIAILSKPAQVRFDFENLYIQRTLYRFQCFNRYPLPVKKELAKVIHYDKFEDGRLIIKQGHQGFSIYFIISGAAIVERSDYDPMTRKVQTHRMGELHPGDMFGELALLHNTNRAASVVCKGTSEFLRVDLPEFNQVLREFHEKEWETRIELLSTHSVFKDWSTVDLKMANGHSKMKTYPPNTVIVGGSKSQNDRVFFIVSGSCSVSTKLQAAIQYSRPEEFRLSLDQSSNEQPEFVKHSVSDHDSNGKNNIDKIFSSHSENGSKDRKTKFFTIAKLTEGDYFNVGENLSNLYVITNTRVEVVQVGVKAFIRNGNTRLLDDMRDKYLESLPTFNSVYEKLVKDNMWKSFKRNLIQDIVKIK